MVNDCKLGEKKNVNVPGVKVDIPVVDEREIKDIEEWAVPNNADYIALSCLVCWFVGRLVDVGCFGGILSTCGGVDVGWWLVVSPASNCRGFNSMHRHHRPKASFRARTMSRSAGSTSTVRTSRLRVVDGWDGWVGYGWF